MTGQSQLKLHALPVLGAASIQEQTGPYKQCMRPSCASWSLALIVCGSAALKRKGKGDDVTEDDMGAVVQAHNSKPLPFTQHNDIGGITLLLPPAVLVLCSPCLRASCHQPSLESAQV